MGKPSSVSHFFPVCQACAVAAVIRQRERRRRRRPSVGGRRRASQRRRYLALATCTFFHDERKDTSVMTCHYSLLSLKRFGTVTATSATPRQKAQAGASVDDFTRLSISLSPIDGHRSMPLSASLLYTVHRDNQLLFSVQYVPQQSRRFILISDAFTRLKSDFQMEFIAFFVNNNHSIVVDQILSLITNIINNNLTVYSIKILFQIEFIVFFCQ